MSVFISKKLRYFMVAMEKKCILKAAEALYITRTPLSKIISDTEKDLGGKLFLRTYNTLEPTKLAWDYYYKLIHSYELQMKVESEIKAKDKEKKLKIIFDTGIPELLYRISSAVVQSEIYSNKLECSRDMLNEKIIEENKYNPNVILVSLRDISHFNLYKVDKWLSIQFALVSATNYNNNDLSIYIWRDIYSEYISRRAQQLLADDFPECNIIEHNFEPSHVLYNVSLGKGAVIMPLKLALIYKTESVNVFPVKNKFFQLTFYHNIDKNFMNTYEMIKVALNNIF